MNKFKILALTVIVSGLIISSCTKDKIVTQKITVTPVTDSVALILAGAVSSSKSWKMTAISGTSAPVSDPTNVSAPHSFTLSPCVSDNIYKFSNNANQDYIQNDAAPCNSPDSTIAEQGNWAITNNGKSLVVEGLWFDDLSQDNVPFCLTANGEAFKIVTLTATSLVMSYSYTYQGNNIVITINFTKV